MAHRSKTLEFELQGETRKVPTYDQMAAAQPVPSLTVLHHPKLARVGDRVRLPQLAEGTKGRVELSRLGPELAPPFATATLPLATPFVSRKPVVLSSEAEPDGILTIDASELGPGAVVVDGQPLTGAIAIPRRLLDEGVVIELAEQVIVLLHHLSDQVKAPSHGLVGASDGVVAVRDAITRAARGNTPVLIRGETGTGKELVAHAVHKASTRSLEPYLTVNMAAVPATLAASELFGHAKGAFSGANTASLGYFGRADGGTLFMDEIGDTPRDVQAALLRVLETGELQQVGAQRMKLVDVRLLAATDADLDAEVAAGNFRAPLRYRLSQQEIRIPPLRTRKDDIGRLLVHFLRLELAELGREPELDDTTADGTSWIPATLASRLARHAWPGNVRQLRNVARWLARLEHRQRPVANDAELTNLLGPTAEPLPELTPAPHFSRATAEYSRPAERPASVETFYRGSDAQRATVEVKRGDLLERIEQIRAVEAAAAPTADKRKRSPSEIGPEELEALMERHAYKLGNVADELGISRPALNELVDAHPRLGRAQSLSKDDIIAAQDACGGDLAKMWRVLRVSEKSLKLRMSALGLRS